MQKSWDQVSWVLSWRDTTAFTTSSEFIIHSGNLGSRATILMGVGDGIVVIGNRGRGEPVIITLYM
jgi:hypothetical protein